MDPGACGRICPDPASQVMIRDRAEPRLTVLCSAPDDGSTRKKFEIRRASIWYCPLVTGFQSAPVLCSLTEYYWFLQLVYLVFG